MAREGWETKGISIELRGIERYVCSGRYRSAPVYSAATISRLPPLPTPPSMRAPVQRDGRSEMWGFERERERRNAPIVAW